MKSFLSLAAPLARLAGLGAAILLASGLESAMAGPLKVETIDVAPFGFLGADGKPTGMWYEIVNLITQEAALPGENVLTPFARTAKDLEDGTADLVVRFSNEQLDKNSISIAPVVLLPTVVIGPKGAGFKQVPDLRGKTVGILRGGTYGAAFSGDELIKKFEANDYTQEINMLAAQRLDAAAGSAIGLFYEAAKRGLSKDQLSEPLLLGSQNVFLLFSKKTADDKTVAALRAAVEKLQKQDAFAKVINKYMGDFKWAVSELKQ
jgi:ABC-type amino acid transport substrate-binding protein